MENWFEAKLQTKYTRRLIAWAFVCAGIAALCYTQKRYITNFIMGPYEISSAELDAVTNVAEAPRVFVRVHFSKAVDTGYESVQIKKKGDVEVSRSVAGVYYALSLENRYLVGKFKNSPQSPVCGELKLFTGNFEKDFYSHPEINEIRDRFYSFYLDGDSFRSDGYWGLGIGLIVFFFIYLFVHDAWKYRQDQSLHPLIQRAQSWSNYMQGVITAEKELLASPRIKSGGWLITEHYVIADSFFSFDVFQISDLIWAYKKVTKNSVNFIPTGKTYEAILIFSDGQAEISAQEKVAEEFLVSAAQSAPWAPIGFSAELDDYFKKDPAGFRAAVEQKKKEMLG